MVNRKKSKAENTRKLGIAIERKGMKRAKNNVHKVVKENSTRRKG